MKNCNKIRVYNKKLATLIPKLISCYFEVYNFILLCLSCNYIQPSIKRYFKTKTNTYLLYIHSRFVSFFVFALIFARFFILFFFKNWQIYFIFSFSFFFILILFFVFKHSWLLLKVASAPTLDLHGIYWPLN